ncbi:MAG: sulfotransferase [Steroidobacteraceae bacterium]|nr:sulfotransferase [Steroidobacteraceae bacterium]
MTASLEQLSAAARRAVQAGDWSTTQACAVEILRRDARSAEGHFLNGLAEKAASRPLRAAAAFARALELDPQRYDAAVELADEYGRSFRHGEARALLEQHEPHLRNSPRYLNMAGLTWSLLGMHERAWPLHRRANELQPGVPLFEANLAACSVYLGKIDEARALYLKLLERNPNHQRNHYHLARLARARDSAHVEQMKSVLAANRLPPEKNIFLYYALGKELEDLEQWDEAFHYYELAGDAATRVSRYDVAEDIALIDRIIEVCDAGWLAAGPAPVPTEVTGKTPIFIVGLPRTGTTLTERILASHSQVESLGETLFLQMVLRRVSGVPGVEGMTPEIITAAARQDIGHIADGYLNAVRYRLGTRPLFIEKFPENIFYLGFAAKAYPDARLVHLRRHPMDACFAMYKQSFFRYAYTLENVGRYYAAYDRLARHWRAVLGERLVEVDYEALVGEPEPRTRQLLARLGLEFEPACLEFDRNQSASATASSVQVREKIHTRSVQRWRNFERQLQPLRNRLEGAGIVID